MNKFEELNAIDVSKHVEKKVNFNYLSWTWAVEQLGKVAHDAIIDTKTDAVGFPAFFYGNQAMVWVTVTIDGVTRGQPFPVFEMVRGKGSVATDNPTVVQINNALQRALVKAISLHGLGLYIYAGEDLPESPPIPAKPETIGLLFDATNSGVESFRTAWASISKVEQSRISKEDIDKMRENAKAADYANEQNAEGSLPEVEEV